MEMEVVGLWQGLDGNRVLRVWCFLLTHSWASFKLLLSPLCWVLQDTDRHQGTLIPQVK